MKGGAEKEDKKNEKKWCGKREGETKAKKERGREATGRKEVREGKGKEGTERGQERYDPTKGIKGQ